jgi:hypothetical protein
VLGLRANAVRTERDRPGWRDALGRRAAATAPRVACARPTTTRCPKSGGPATSMLPRVYCRGPRRPVAFRVHSLKVAVRPSVYARSSEPWAARAAIVVMAVHRDRSGRTRSSQWPRRAEKRTAFRGTGRGTHDRPCPGGIALDARWRVLDRSGSEVAAPSHACAKPPVPVRLRRPSGAHWARSVATSPWN